MQKCTPVCCFIWYKITPTEVFMNTILKTPRLTLRPMGPGDLETTFAYAGSPENAQYMLFLPYTSIEETQAELVRMEAKMQKKPLRDYFFAIEFRGAHIGEISLELSPTMTEAELGWIIHRNYWGNGFMTEAAVTIRDFAFHTLGLKKLYAHCDSRNVGSYRVMEHIGMALEATGSRRNRISGEISAEYKYSLYHS